jgi:NADPH:quinone reductase
VGAIPIATTRNKSKEEPLRQAGARHVVNTKSGNWVEEALAITSGQGVEPRSIPWPDLRWKRVASATRMMGTVFLYGALSLEPTPFPLAAAIGKNLSFRGYTLFSIVQSPERAERAKRWVYDHLENGKLKPRIARNFPLGQIVEAHRFMESNEQIGKIVVTA